MKTRNSLAFLLHARDYSETSVIASFLTKDFGILNALLKGAKRKGVNLQISYRQAQNFISVTLIKML